MVTGLERALLQKISATGSLVILDDPTKAIAYSLQARGLIAQPNHISVRWMLTALGSSVLATSRPAPRPRVEPAPAPAPSPAPAPAMATRAPANIVGLPPKRGMIRGVPQQHH